jgi:single-strand DNA-binding protein
VTSINRVVIVGHLTRDPELRSTAGGSSVCRMRVACNTRWRNGESGEWEERPNFFDVSVFGASGDACARILEKGRAIAVDGRLDWHEWESAEGDRRQAVGIVADNVQFLTQREGGGAASEVAEPEAEAIAF